MKNITSHTQFIPHHNTYHVYVEIHIYKLKYITKTVPFAACIQIMSSYFSKHHIIDKGYCITRMRTGTVKVFTRHCKFIDGKVDNNIL